MHTQLRWSAVASLSLLALLAFSQEAVEQSVGPKPDLPAPDRGFGPTVDIASANPWPDGAKPKSAVGIVNAFAVNFDHPRWLYVLPNGDVLVAEANAPNNPEKPKGVKTMIKNRLMKKAGAATPSADRITLLRDADGDGTAEVRSAFMGKLRSPFGMALVGNQFYVANTDAVVAFDYKEGDKILSGEGEIIVDLPSNQPNRHWTKSLIASADGFKLYVGVGSNSNIAEGGIESEEGRAAIWEIDPKRKTKRLFATGGGVASHRRTSLSGQFPAFRENTGNCRLSGAGSSPSSPRNFPSTGGLRLSR